MRTTSYITPNCCEKAKSSKAVRLGQYPDKTKPGEWKDIKPKWYIVGDQILGGEHFNSKIEIDKCPFCGKSLPDVEINDKYSCEQNSESKYKVVEGDEEYCATCGQRHMCCSCYPPEYRWKIKE